MRYILDPDFESEKQPRLRYLHEVFGVFFIETLEPLINGINTTWSKGRPSAFISVPADYADDICIIYGHNKFAEILMKKQKTLIPETKVFIISCKADVNWNRIRGNKKIYFPRMETDVEERYSQEKYHMDFPPTDPELNLYNVSADKAPFEALYWAFELDR